MDLLICISDILLGHLLTEENLKCHKRKKNNCIIKKKTENETNATDVIISDKMIRYIKKIPAVLK